jgi:hypothetical protein
VPTRPTNTEVLRVVGQFLDREAARQIEIFEAATFVTVAWRTDAGERQRRDFTHDEIEDLQKDARFQRGTPIPDVPSSLAEVLRTLGQMLDVQQVSVSSITEEPDGYRIKGLGDGRLVHQLVTRAGLHLASRRAVTRRKAES